MKRFPIKKGCKFPPLIKDWENKATDDPEQIAAWERQFPGCNWGIACGPSNRIVVDEDEPGAILALELEGILDFPVTREVQTPRPGRHLYYIGRIKSSVKKYPGIDIKSVGGYVLAPGSRTHSGEYTVIRDCEPVLPDPRLLECGPPEEYIDHSLPACTLDSPSAILRAKEYADHQAEPSIQGEGGDLNAFRVACRIRDLGVSRDVCFEILSGRWNDRCKPPWDFEDLETKIGNAYRYARGQAGSADAAADFASIPIEEDPSEEKEDIYKLFSWQDLVDDPPPREWIVDQWLPQGEVTSLYGDGGQGKSTLALQLAIAVAHGLPWLGLETKQMPVLCVMAEDDQNEINRRANAIKRSPGLDFAGTPMPLQFFAVPSADYTIAAFDERDKLKQGRLYNYICTWLEAMPPGPKLLVIDTLADTFAGNENARSQANRFVKVVLRGLASKYAATPLLLAHPSRAGLSNEDMLSGSTAWNNAVRNRLALIGHKDLPDARVLCRVKSNYARSGERITLEYQNGAFVARDDSDMFKVMVTGYEAQIIALLAQGVAEDNPFGDTRNHGRPIWEYLGGLTNGDGKPMKKETLKKVIDALIDAGRVTREKGKSWKNGLYPA